MKNKLLVFLFLFLSIRVYSQSCTLTVNITASNAAICSGNPVVLTAVPSAGTPAYNYVWSTGETTQSITVNKVATYTVTVADQGGCQASKNIAITSGVVPDAPVAADEFACLNTSATLTATAPGGTYQWYDSAIGGNFLASGATFHTPAITVKTIFYVETTLSGCTSARTAVTVYPLYPPGTTGGSTCPGSSVTLTASGANTYQWYDAPSGGNLVGTGPSFTTPALFTTTNYYVVGLTNGCITSPATATATIFPAPAAPTAADITTCSGSSVNLHASSAVSGTTFDWFNVPTGGTSIISSPDYTTGALTATTIYYVQATVNGCIGPRTAVTVTVNPIPVAPTAADVSTCSGSVATLTATAPGGTYQWFATASATTVLFTGPVFTTPVLNSATTYYVQVVNGGCTSARTAVNVTINPSPTAPIASGQTICSGSTVTLSATGPGGSYEWYDATTGGNLLIAGASYTTPVLTTTTTYYVQTTISGCTSPRTPVTVTVNAVPAAPTASSTTACSGATASLSASGTGNSYEWYDAATGGTLLASTQTFVTPALSANATYYVQTISGTCISPRTAVTVTVNPLPAAPTGSNATTCAGTSATLTASAATGIVQWYSAATGGTLLASGNTYTTPALSATRTYYIQAINGGCTSSRNPITVTVISTTNQFTYSSGTYCTSGANPSPQINVTGGTFSASPAGMVIDASTGEINLAASVTGSYTITYSNACAVSSLVVAIVTTPDANFTYGAASYCQGSTNAVPIYTNPSGSAGVFTSSGTGLVFVKPSTGINTGEIDMSASAPGSYTITNTINVSGCPVTTASTTVTIDPKVNVNAGPNQTIATNTSAQLAGAVSGGATTGTWTAGSGTFSDPTALNATYTPAVGVTSVTLILTSADPGTSCGPRQDQVVINIIAKPPAPTASGAAVCFGSPATLKANGAANYQWYDAATGGNLLVSTQVFVTPALTVNTTYYVQTTTSTVASTRTPVTVTINAIPAAPTILAVPPVCSGNTATIIAGGSAGTYQWYGVPTGGSLLSTGSSFTTGNLTANKTYYVQTTLNGCTSARTQIDVTVKPLPLVTSAATNSICSNNALTYNITSNMPATTFTWARAAVTGISNPPLNNQTSSVINETLINTTGSNKNVTYVITPFVNGCSGPNFNYVVTVYPVSVITSAANIVVCSGSSVNYNITFNVSGTLFNWSRVAVAGISNPAVSGQMAGSIQEALTNTTTAPIDVVYLINYSTINCAGSTFSLKVTVNPRVIISSAKTGVACGGTPQNYVITSNVPTAVYSWSRAAIADISNPAITSNTGIINESLVNTGTAPVTVNYIINTTNNGCQLTPFTYSVLVYPQPPTPIANSNSPVCSGKDINLLTPTIVAGATYSWTGPNGFASALKNPTLTNVSAANAGTYTLYIIVNGCSSVGASVDVAVDALPIANAGPDQIVCNAATTVTLAGNVGGGTITGVWTTAGTGTFSPTPSQLNGQYLPSAQDKANGSVKLTLVSTSKDDCNISTDEMIIKFQLVPATDAGADQAVCSQNTTVILDGKILIPGNGTWSTSGTGTFIPSPSQINDVSKPTYVPSAADVANGSVTLSLTANSPTSCDLPTDEMIVKLLPPPKINAGGIRYVLKDKTIVLNPTVNDNNVSYLWSPNVFINNNTIKNPTITADVDRVYTLQVTDSRGCISTDSVRVIVSPPIVIPNAFTPNADGINDLWEIKGLIAYPDVTVDIFNRNGQKVYHSISYGKPWDGTYNGKALPFGTYYYVIDTKMYGQVYSGYVSVIK